MRAEHINITIPVELKNMIDTQTKLERIPRSTLIQKALRVYLELSRKKRLKEQLEQGYSEMAGEAIRIMEDFKGFDGDGLKYVD